MEILHIVLSAILMILLISVLILVHEFGHFLAAKAVGMRVDKFGFGLPVGPTLFSKKVGETEILIHAFLLGGYVAFPDDEDEKCDLPKDSPLRFANKSVGQRAFVISAGVICNIIIAYFLIFFTGLFWQKLPANTYTVTFEKFSPDAVQSILNSGLQPKDIIYSINDTEVIYPQTVRTYILLSREFDGRVDKKIYEEKLEKLSKLNPSLDKDDVLPVGTVVKLPEFTDEAPLKLTMDNIIGLEKYKSDEVQLTEQQKELTEKINYQKKYKLENEAMLSDIAYAISDTKKALSIVVLRNGKKVTLNKVYPPQNGLLGISQSYIENHNEIKNFKQLVKETIDYAYYTEDMMIRSFGKLFTGKIPASELNGIVAVAKIGTEIIAYKGIADGILLTAMISLNLALMNILPIPALDGGHLLFLFIEKITGKPVNKKFVEILSNFFFYLLICLMVLILYNDIHAWIIGKI